MQKLAWVLGIVALCFSVFLGTSGVLAYRGARQAAAAVKKTQDRLDSIEFADDMKAQELNTEIETAEITLHTDELDIQIAEEEGKSPAKAMAKQIIDLKSLQTLRLINRMNEDAENVENALGGSLEVQSAMERVEAAQRSLSVYSAVVTRDEHLAYAAGLVWLAFGFSIALAARERRLPRSETQ